MKQTQMTGRIVKALSGFYYVNCDGAVYECKARGSFRKSGVSPLVSDVVTFEPVGQNSGIIIEISQRKSFLTRPAVANIDRLFIVSAYESPVPNCSIIDRMTVIAEKAGIEPIIVFNKCDIGPFTDLQSIYSAAGFNVCTVSAKSGDGIDKIKALMKDCVSAFTGNSGVGKSSILNAVLGRDSIATGEVSQKLGRGRHTTRHIELFDLDFGGFVVDTPGFSSLEFNPKDYLLHQNLALYFREFEPFLKECKFTSCTHTKESGCAVLRAVNDGEIAASRHKSYTEFFEETKDFKPWK